MSDEEEEPKKKSGLIKIVIFAVAGLMLVGVGLGVGFFVFGGSEPAPDDLANQIIASNGGTPVPAPAPAPEEGEGEGEEGEGDGSPSKITKETPNAEVFQTLYYEFPGNLTTNLRGSRRYLQVGIAISTQYDEQVINNVETHLPALRSEILAVLSDYSEEDVVGREARLALADALKEAMNARLEELEGFGGIEGVQFVTYVMQ